MHVSVDHPRRVDARLTGKGEIKLPWREAGPPNYHDDEVNSDHQVVNEELSLSNATRTPAHICM
jgi:hypothetical protein